MKLRSGVLINSNHANVEVINKRRPKRRLKPAKPDYYYYFEPVVKHRRLPNLKTQSDTPLIIPGESPAKDRTSSKDVLIDSGNANEEVNTRPKRCVRPPKLDDYHLEPAVKHKRLKTNNAAQKIQEASSTIQNLTVGVGFNDKVCSLCGADCDLVLCDSCPSAFHKTCLEIQELPFGEWHCIYCLCKFCGAFEHRRALNSEMVKCSLCEQKFHKSCAKASSVYLDELSFCGTECHEVYNKLQRNIGLKIDLEDGFSCTFVKRYDLGRCSISSRKICNKKLMKALKILNDCFEPSFDETTQTNIIKNIVYSKWSKFRRLDYSGFCMAILEKGTKMISVATIRIQGGKVAEMPYIGTATKHRRQGMCRRLLDSIEKILCALGVWELVIPATSDTVSMWRDAYGFKPLEESTKEKMKSMSIVIFHDSKMLQKHVKNKNNNK